MVTYWLDGERKAGNRHFSEMEKMSSQNSSMDHGKLAGNPPDYDYTPYNFAGKSQQPQPQPQTQPQTQSLVNIE